VNLIVRLIAPLISQPSLADGGVAASGIGDITTSVFISPAHLRRWCGLGDALRLQVKTRRERVSAANEPAKRRASDGVGAWGGRPQIKKSGLRGSKPIKQCFERGDGVRLLV
jgi:hypothetical protein